MLGSSRITDIYPPVISPSIYTHLLVRFLLFLARPVSNKPVLLKLRGLFKYEDQRTCLVLKKHRKLKNRRFFQDNHQLLQLLTIMCCCCFLPCSSLDFLSFNSSSGMNWWQAGGTWLWSCRELRRSSLWMLCCLWKSQSIWLMRRSWME